ncbi:glycoside hydrolase family 5 protein [Staphylococcus epidermidis]|nr:glycoside hydrolase family 5 protein [Streptococcus pneumoniae]MCG1139696.1 glycoside hydrolase family 5 protein [Staphylococcus epidermidis]MCG1144301.1 glycoside hydrolase family 5 protein [Staphylococcus epidermidis]MCG1159962.1 glycoside hydrolase family 5 protein [Staphylococcus epidermidis]MCG1185070.1 glycoside hydrolase family 5 protein [Staphylococcus epidermidis]
MKKAITCSLLVATTLASSISNLNTTHTAHADDIGQLTTKGTAIQKNGHDYQLKGVNAGNVFTTEGYLGGITGDKYKNYSKPFEHKTYKELKDALDEKYGPKEAKKKLNMYADNRWTDKDFQNIKDMGMNTIRLPLNYINLTNYKKGMNPDDVKMTSHSFDEVDKFIQKAKTHGLYVIIDFHGAPNSQNGAEHSADKNGGSNGLGHFWDDNNAQEKAKDILNNVARHYKDENTVAGYDILNEPKGVNDGSSDKQVNKFYKEAVKSIRDAGDKHIIFLEAVWNPENLENPDYYNDTAHNLVYEYHNYATADDSSVEESFRKKLDKINSYHNPDKENNIKYNVPSYLGEFNTQSMSGGPNANNDDLEKIINKTNKIHTSWTFWNYDVQGGGNWGAYKYKSVNENPDSPNFGKKSGEEPNEPIYSNLKESTR